MKSLLVIFLLLSNALVVHASDNIDFKHELSTLKKIKKSKFKYFKKLKKNHKAKSNNHLVCKETTIKKKNGKTTKRKFIKKIFNKKGKLKKKITHVVFIDDKGKKDFKAPYIITEIDNQNPNVLTAEIDSFNIKKKSKDKYQPIDVKYKVFEPEENFVGRKDKITAKLYEVNGKTRLDINIADLKAGEYDLFLRIASNKTVHIEQAAKKKEKDSKKKKLKKYVHKANIRFTKAPANLLADMVILEQAPLNSRILLDMSNSSSDQGVITKFITRLFENDELSREEEYYTSETTEFGYVFTSPDTTYQIELEVFDEFGNSAKTLSEKITPIAVAPVINYALTPNETYLDTFTVNFAGSTLPPGAENFSFFGIRVLRDGIVLEDKFSSSGEFEFQIKTRGNFTLMLVVGASNGTLNIAIDPVNYLAPDIPETLHLNYSHHFFGDDDPRKLFVAFTNQITQEQFKQFNVTLTHLASGFTTSYVSAQYIFDQSILHALVGTTVSGEYRFDIQLELIDGTKSAPFSITETFDINLGVASLKVNLEQILEKPRAYNIDSTGSSPGNYGNFINISCNAVHIDSNESFTIGIGETPQEINLWKPGTWGISCNALTSLGLTASFNQELNIINLEPQLALDISLTNATDRSYTANINASDLDGEISSLKLTLQHQDIVDQEYDVGTGDFPLYLTNVGTYTIILTGIDSDGAVSTTSKSVEVINQIPTLDYNIITINENNREFQLQASYQDIDGYIIRAVLLMTSPSGNNYSYEIGESIPLALSEAGTYSFSLSAQDQDGEWSQEVTKQFEVINKLPIADFEIFQISPDRYFFVVQNSTDSDGYLIEYNFTFKGPNGELLTNQISSNFEIQLSSAGIWNASLTVKDNDGDISAPLNKIIDITNQIPSASFLVELREDKKGVNVSASGNDPDGSSISYILKATDVDGQMNSSEFNSDEFTADLNKPGIWNIELTAKDSDGGGSNPSMFQIEIEDFAPIASFEIINTNGIYSLDASASSDDYQIDTYQFTVTNPRNETVEYNEVNVLNANLNFDGAWKVDLVVTDNKGQESEIVSKSLLIDNLPPDPGPENNETLAGIDSDGDGVRDDIEHIINNIQVSEQKKSILKETAKDLQEALLTSDSLSESITSTYRRVNYKYCVKSTLTESEQIHIDKISFEFLNTKERVIAWAKTWSNFNGQAVVSESDVSKYSDYCNR